MDAKILLQSQTSPKVPPTKHRLKLKDPGIVAHYTDLLEQQLMYHKYQRNSASWSSKLRKEAGQLCTLKHAMLLMI
jgi:hypothetical protein